MLNLYSIWWYWNFSRMGGATETGLLEMSDYFLICEDSSATLPKSWTLPTSTSTHRLVSTARGVWPRTQVSVRICEQLFKEQMLVKFYLKTKSFFFRKHCHAFSPLNSKANFSQIQQAAQDWNVIVIRWIHFSSDILSLPNLLVSLSNLILQSLETRSFIYLTNIWGCALCHARLLVLMM